MLKKHLSHLPEEQIKKLETLVDLFMEWNSKLNLSSIRERHDIMIKHVIDSLLITKLDLLKPGMKVLDLGTGGGFPGLPLAIVYPEIQFTLVDSTKKKIDAVESMVNSLSLTNVTCYNSRAEQLGHSPSHRNKYNIVVARALAGFSTLLEYCTPFVKTSGLFIAYQGPDIIDQLPQSKKAQELLNTKVIDQVELDLPENAGRRIFVVCKKLSETPEEYPRSVGLPKKRPLGEKII
jgi:16S rRNA (guanine527-N7)-methyltransferase